jgi:hypothetical protein
VSTGCTSRQHLLKPYNQHTVYDITTQWYVGCEGVTALIVFNATHLWPALVGSAADRLEGISRTTVTLLHCAVCAASLRHGQPCSGTKLSVPVRVRQPAAKSKPAPCAGNSSRFAHGTAPCQSTACMLLVWVHGQGLASAASIAHASVITSKTTAIMLVAGATPRKHMSKMFG